MRKLPISPEPLVINQFQNTRHSLQKYLNVSCFFVIYNASVTLVTLHLEQLVIRPRKRWEVGIRQEFNL